MNFTITLNGEGPELESALRTLRSALDGQVISGGSVSANLTPAAPQQQEAPVYQQHAPVQQQVQQGYQQQQFDQQTQPQMQTFQQLQPNQGYQLQNQQTQQQTQPGYHPQQQPINSGVPVSTTTFSMDQLSVAATQLMDAGRKDELLGLLAQFGVPALTLLPKEHYGDFATRLRAMGAKI